jgi:hypothetical protein
MKFSSEPQKKGNETIEEKLKEIETSSLEEVERKCHKK